MWPDSINALKPNTGVHVLLRMPKTHCSTLQNHHRLEVCSHSTASCNFDQPDGVQHVVLGDIFGLFVLTFATLTLQLAQMLQVCKYTWIAFKGHAHPRCACSWGQSLLSPLKCSRCKATVKPSLVDGDSGAIGYWCLGQGNLSMGSSI